MSEVSLPPGITVAKTLGCIELAIVLNALFMGIVFMQFLTYWQEQKDGRFIRCLVAYVFLVNIVHSIITIELLWKLTVTNFGNPLALLESQWELEFTLIFIALTVIPIQLFLGWRVRQLATNKTIGIAFFVLITLMALAHGAVEIYLVVYNLIANITVDGYDKFVSGAIAWAATGFATDTIVNSALVYTLYSRKTGFKTSDNIITRIIHVIILSGLPLSVFGFGQILANKLGIMTGVPYVFAVPVGRVYSNTLLTILNSRTRIRSANNTSASHSDGVNMIDTSLVQRINARASFGIGQTPLKVQVSRSQNIQMDDLRHRTEESNKGYKDAW